MSTGPLGPRNWLLNLNEDERSDAELKAALYDQNICVGNGPYFETTSMMPLLGRYCSQMKIFSTPVYLPMGHNISAYDMLRSLVKVANFSVV